METNPVEAIPCGFLSIFVPNIPWATGNGVKTVWEPCQPANLIVRTNRGRYPRNTCEVKGMVVD